MRFSNVARLSRSAALAAALIAAAGAAPAHAAQPTIPVLPVASMLPPEPDVAASNAKVQAAYGALVGMWREEFGRLGARFAPPALLRYRGNVRTVCGTMPENNAIYCPSRNAIFFDELFLARQAGDAGRHLGTDGDMVAVGIIAHEMGHAVAAQLGADSPIPYENEAIADCLAGAFAQRSAKDGSLEPGDLEEAFFGMAAAGDPAPRLTGNERRDRRIVLAQRLYGHGSRDQRMANFERGYRGGGGACVEELQ